MRHAVELMPAIEALTRGQGWAPRDLDHVYLSLGPGSFTGLRIAVAIARALAQAAGCRIVGVPTLDVLAQNAPPEFPVVVPILDAKRGQVFAARYERALPVAPAGAAPPPLVRVTDPALVDPQSFLEEAAARARTLAGAGRPPAVAVLGEGVDYYRPAIHAVPAAVELDHTLWPGRAIEVYRLGLARAAAGHFSDPAALLPLYIRLPEAEEVYRKKHGLPLA
jgi:tRNA threonylcarbamoyladenosine biosynthesis protein TsaB